MLHDKKAGCISRGFNPRLYSPHLHIPFYKMTLNALNGHARLHELMLNIKRVTQTKHNEAGQGLNPDQKHTFKNIQYESDHWAAGRWRGRIPRHITQLVNYGLPSDDFVVFHVLQSDDPAAHFDVLNDLTCQRSTVKALGMVPYLLE